MLGRGLAIALACVLALAGGACLVRSSDAASAPIGRYPLQTRGVVTKFENPSSPYGWGNGDTIKQVASASGRAAVAEQFDRMRAMGVNEVSFELRTADSVFVPGARTPPGCNDAPFDGLQWPQPTQYELAGLSAFFDLARSKGVHVALMLENTHMEEQPPTNSTQWLGAILSVVKDKPALDYITFGGDEHLLDLNGDGIRESCGGQSEAPLWLGASAVGSRYVAWAIRYGMSLGLPASKLTAEAIVGAFEDLLGEGPQFWRPILVLKQIFDEIGIPQAKRTYALSLYEHRKCTLPPWLSIACTEQSPHEWADATLRSIVATVGSGARLTAPEFGDATPVEAPWPTAKAVESLGVLMQQYGVDGGDFWVWVWLGPINDPTLADPVVIRGHYPVAYNPVQRELADLYGFHLTTIPNGSFETGARAWTFGGRGTARPMLLDQSDLPWRGKTFLRLTAIGTDSITSAPVRVSGSTTYTTTANLRFGWSQDPKPTRVPWPQIDVVFHYLTCARHAVAGRTDTTFRYFQGAPNTFRTFPLKYSTPRDACYVRIEFVAARNHLANPLTLDIDNVR